MFVDIIGCSDKSPARTILKPDNSWIWRIVAQQRVLIVVLRREVSHFFRRSGQLNWFSVTVSLLVLVVLEECVGVESPSEELLLDVENVHHQLSSTDQEVEVGHDDDDNDCDSS